MNARLPYVTLLLALASFPTVTGCAEETDDTDHRADDLAATAGQQPAAPCVSYPVAKATFDREVKAAKDKILADYDAAMDRHSAGVAAAKEKLDAAFASIPEGEAADTYSSVLNLAIAEYNETVRRGGPLDRAYNASVATAKAIYERTTQAALDKFHATVC